MTRPDSRRTQGTACIVVGVAAILVEGVVLLTDSHLDEFILTRAPVIILVGIVLIVIGVARLRGRITR